ncbi:hypothetical protein BGP77_08035 [Saccharospirillum sp. MSK14-1]|uniref:RNA polymerase sigma factor n=1 Tax=Saccharospirillum sp. MSK14-1 TaxID=1897632 RepID=UPI000D4B4E7C|nr:sigma-70 family RNA polymerase sigma factor [Saccharospirillum sp. MSK14-1]PTY37205.1 hypothetical protein BGP77_08035 [Saccharospirillum sp. MSK14-1]
MSDFDALVHHNRGRLYRLSRAYSDSPDAAADLHQEMLLQLWRAWPGFAGRAQASTWLYRVALNTAISQWRYRPVSTADYQDHEQASAEPGPDVASEQQQLLEAVNRALKTFNEVDRALVLLYLEQYSYAEMADVIGLTTNAVGVKLNRLKQRLSQMLEEGGQ